MKIIVTIILFLNVGLILAQENNKPYDVGANASKQIYDAVNTAALQKKHIILQIGGNWCPWCIKLAAFVKNNAEIDSMIKADFVYVHINYSKENRNMEVMQRLEYPQRLGFPVLVILDGTGKRIHTQNTSYLEEEKSYNRKKVFEFLNDWAPKAINPEKYLE